MDRQKLSEFYSDEMMKEVVKSFLLDTLKLEAIERVFKKEDVSGIADAKTVIDKAFLELQVMFGKKEKPKIKNNAR